MLLGVLEQYTCPGFQHRSSSRERQTSGTHTHPSGVVAAQRTCRLMKPHRLPGLTLLSFSLLTMTMLPLGEVKSHLSQLVGRV
jgi:hypothetical protein